MTQTLDKESGFWDMVTSLGGKEPELVREVEQYRLEIVGLASTHSLGPGTQLLERGWTLFYSGVPHAYGPNSSVAYPAFLETLRGVLEGARGWMRFALSTFSGCCGAVLADTSLQHSVAVKDSAFGLGDQSGGPSF
ncbi:hypothetical protein QTP70_033805 [Hemibagrus guttatus]|uniref:Uncharacterized protein n=1 Tax=Hemibagrus guttatus TaxID=175788 RepID=A0AAE0Q791_9TELE|nr:hypothetical protein QTP70_033805 [Hemibagrus guttatus]KAK3538834.1 hypothetical protein QTP86_015953 [Hemibagrus guttatus]